MIKYREKRGEKLHREDDEHDDDNNETKVQQQQQQQSSTTTTIKKRYIDNGRDPLTMTVPCGSGIVPAVSCSVACCNAIEVLSVNVAA